MELGDLRFRVPELPEVETVRIGLENSLLGRKITQTRILITKMLKGSVTDPAELDRILSGERIMRINRRGKYLIFDLESGYHLLFHLKMRGHIVVVPLKEPDGKYLSMGLTIDNSLEMRFHDMWTWGEIRLVNNTELLNHPGLSEMGEEPLSDNFTWESLKRSLSRRSKTAVKTALLDQAVVAGVGNIYADESLFRSGIMPTRSAGSLTDDECYRLHKSIKEVLQNAINYGGTESDDFIDTSGNAGNYRPLVYGRSGKSCTICGNILQRIKMGGRGTVYCAQCQS